MRPGDLGCKADDLMARFIADASVHPAALEWLKSLPFRSARTSVPDGRLRSK